MALAEEYINAGKYPSHFVIIAEEQTQGRGRKATDWQSSPGGLWCNLVLDHISTQRSFTLYIGYCITKALNELAKTENFKSKWPNDIYLNNHKICGVICSQYEHQHKTSIGIGINTNTFCTPYPSVREILDITIPNNIYLDKIINNIIENLSEFELYGLDYFLDYYKKHDFLQDKVISVISGKKTFHGKYSGINEDGALLLHSQDEVKPIYSGSISL